MLENALDLVSQGEVFFGLETVVSALDAQFRPVSKGIFATRISGESLEIHSNDTSTNLSKL